MAKFTWQNGTLVSKAKVEINGTIYEVDPEEYSGATPLSASNLNAMQDGIYEDIGDLSSLDTSDKSSLVTAINEINNTRLIKLWENPSPNSNFTSQTISLQSDDYDFLVIFFGDGYDYGSGFGSILKGQSYNHGWVWDYDSGNNVYYNAGYRRSFNYVNDTTYNVSDCYVRYGGSSSNPTANNYCIPLKIYGGKF